MKKEKLYLISIIILCGLSYYQFLRDLCNVEEISNLKYQRDSYKKAYLKANTINKHNDSLHSSGFLINLSNFTEENLNKKLNKVK